jgi:hypothetical protein
MNDTVVYTHTRLDTNEIFYVGIGNTKRPYIVHNRGNWWKRIVAKAGYRVDILFENLSWVEACAREIALIEFYGRKDLGTGTLINMTDGGEGAKGYIRVNSEAAKLKMSKSHMGKTLSKEHKRNISEGAKMISPDSRRKQSEAQKQPIIQLDLDGNKIIEWESAIDAEINGGFTKTHIGAVCRGQRKTHAGFKWEYVN